MLCSVSYDSVSDCKGGSEVVTLHGEASWNETECEAAFMTLLLASIWYSNGGNCEKPASLHKLFVDHKSLRCLVLSRMSPP